MFDLSMKTVLNSGNDDKIVENVVSDCQRKIFQRRMKHILELIKEAQEWNLNQKMFPRPNLKIRI